MQSDGQWEKLLWKNQSFPDNYVPDSFLSSLIRNANFRPYSYLSLVLTSGAIVQQLATIFIFLAIFVNLKERILDPRILVWLSIAAFILGHTIWERLDLYRSDTHARRTDRAKAVKSSILVFLALLALSPVLKTLTAATSSDSIWALSSCLFVFNVVFADYSPGFSIGLVRERLTSVLSMNAAISSSVVLASRLSDDLAVFALMLFSVQVFALFPILRHKLQVAPAIVQIILTVLLAGLSIRLASPLSTTVVFILGIMFMFVTFVGPWVLFWSQRYKNEIRGPWDVAVPKVN
ncbi:phosphatidylinositol N-acetylglucosaminyltransferase [Neolentinus lepideus HHB14362 ss-1]|uniref:Phosphatidylinositol N-acetylglucosaminyltransferase n=1 Tax=Neolentinus lepideus HHB14362 ss-1 TaxID=1314782 RepID=A0A165VYM5_9AGAM|nr:phosphatidylinositol N-acetylglucosaminyltransferase [Neolentinus lepideus HHB14362 ss-1]